ncbi:tenascin-N isoform X1 [Polyodon spathula]|uniref:tenascin-N isoform X1 n=1 Tax=Polyodon spathula TaxID=7913 RepID=UPI001B7DE577|nr:tenascin-N isoform X1 [Polyodon spathula]
MTLSIRPLLLLGALCVCTADKPAPDQTGDHEITFRHIYNIDQPKSSDCKLELDSLPANGEGTELVATPVSLNADNNMVFKHNIRLQTPKCDCGASEAFKSMLFKLNRLEEEVTYLKDQCSQGCCGGGAGLASLCSGHGSFKRDTCSCDCHEGWEGEDCSTRSCPNECSDNGRCVDGKCVCYEGYIGVDCSEQLCLNDCSDKGRCVDGMCQCFSGFTGEDCSQRTCLNDCSSNGECDDGVCICEEGFFGDNCSQVLGPKEFHLVKASEESLLVSWDYVPGAEYYLLTYYPEGAEGKIKQIKVPKTKNSHLITGLTSGVIYIINLYTFIKYISSEPSNLVASTVVSSIDSVNVVSQMEDSIHVEWKNPPTEVDFFKLTVVNPEGQENEIRVQKAKGAKTSYIIRDLQPGTLYLIKVQAVKEDIEGKPFSVNGVTDIDGPSNLVTKSVTEDTVTLTWNRVQALIDGYRISYTSADGQSQEISVGADRNSYKLTGLRPGVEYTVYIWAMKGNRSSKKTSTKAITEIDAPTNLVTKSVTEDTATLTWNRVQALIDGYRISYTSADGQSQEISVGADRNSHKLTGLRPGVEYTVYIWAMKGNRSSKKTSTKAVTEIDAPSNLVTKSVTEDTATLTWNRVQALIDGYRISYTSADGQSQEISVVADRNSHKLTGLRPGVEYTVYIWAMKGNRSSKKTSTKAITEIDAPTNLVTKSVTEDTATLTWNRVQALIDGYRISYTSADGQSQEISVGADRNSHKLTGLRPGVEYTVYIWAMKGNRSSKKTSTKAVTEIDAPTNLRVTDVKQASGVVMWTLPQAVISGYILTYKRADGKGQEKEKTLSSADESYLLGGLEQGVHYIVRLVAFRGVMRSKTVETTFTTVGDLFPFPMDCTQAMKNGNTLNGIYTIYLNSDRSQPMKVYCDMTTDGGGWIVIQRRNSGKIDFLKRWKNYTQGFGDMNEEFWLGLDKMYDLTNSQQYELRVDLRAGSESAYAIYDNFKLAPATEKYKLTIGNYRGTAGDAMTYHQGRAFTTVDRDNDIALSNCAFTHHGAWWYRNCHLANLNGQYGQTTHSVGVNWEPWKGHEFSIPFVEMKIRPRSENPVPGRMKKSLSGRGKRKTE